MLKQHYFFILFGISLVEKMAAEKVIYSITLSHAQRMSTKNLLVFTLEKKAKNCKEKAAVLVTK